MQWLTGLKTYSMLIPYLNKKVSPILLLIGQRFGDLQVICRMPSKNGHRMFKCQCECGNYTIVRGSALVSGNTMSCGCYDKKVRIGSLNKGRRTRANGATKNGKVTVEYNAYRHIKGRCYRVTDAKYKNYGGRGIRVCDRWLEDYRNFLSDMGKRPKDCNSIERLDVNKDYEPSNCIWGTEEVQAKNKTNTIRLLVGEEEIHQAGLAKRLGVDAHSVSYHLSKGKSGDEIVSYFKDKGYVYKY